MDTAHKKPNSADNQQTLWGKTRRMTKSIKFQRAMLDAIFEPLERFLDIRRRKKSFMRPIICGEGCDALRYYENGHYVVVESELMSGRELDRIIYRSVPMKWDDTGEQLKAEDVARVIQYVCGYFDQNNVRWKYGDVG
jgi:hypothetical protein